MDHQDLLLLLNIDARLSRDAICRLGMTIDTWCGRRCTAERARAIGISLDHLEIAHRILDAPEAAAKEWERLEREAIEPVFSFDAGYPGPLLDLELPPPVLYRRGELIDAPSIAIVGPRRPDAWAREVTRWFARDLAAAGLLIVSGFARGIDTLAHESALEARGATVAILGCGIDVDYPRGSSRLKQAIVGSGAVLSEFPPGTTPRPHHFPIRNRLIAALGFATLVIQADLRSGSLITARLALDLGREVLAVPGRPIDRNSRGSNALLRDGATVALEPSQILDTLPLAIQDALANRGANGEEPEGDSIERQTSALERRLLESIAADQKPAQQIASELDIDVAAALAVLSRLEINGLVRRCTGATFLRSR